MASSKPTIYELREAHPEVLCRTANNWIKVLNNDYSRPKGSIADLQIKNNYEQAANELLGCAKKEVLYQSKVIGRPDVTKVFTECSDDVMTKFVYNNVVPGLLDNKEVVPMYRGLAGTQLLADCAESIFSRNPLYSSLQNDAVNHAIGAISEKLPESGKAGVLKAGLTHEAKGTAVGSFADKLTDRGIEVVKVQPSGYWDETSAKLKELGIDMYKPGFAGWRI